MPDTHALLPPLPRADHRPLIDAAAWRAAQAAHAAALADAALALGRLDACVAAMGPGAGARLALAETEAMLWAAATPLRREEIGADLMDARAATDLDAMAQARWAVRRLQGQAPLGDLRRFLGLHHGAADATTDAEAEPGLRPAGDDFDALAGDFQALVQGAALHPLVGGALALTGWRLAGLSPAGALVEPAVWAARAMAAGCEALGFVPLGQAGRRVWVPVGPPEARVGAMIAAITTGTREARDMLARLAGWRDEARAATAGIRGQNPARIIDALLARPLMSTQMVEEAAGISRDTAERLLARMAGMGIVREITGTRRFRLWCAAA